VLVFPSLAIGQSGVIDLSGAIGLSDVIGVIGCWIRVGEYPREPAGLSEQLLAMGFVVHLV